MNNPHILIEGVSVFFPLYHGNARSLKKTVMAAASGRLGQDLQHRVVVQALRDISFSLHGGDRLGLIGSNGAGKTTLLRTLAGIYEPVIGRVEVQGSLNALLDASLGMNMELTGRENIMLRGLYNGLPRPALATAGGGCARSSPGWATSSTFRCASTRQEWWSAWVLRLPQRSSPRSC